MPRSTTAFRIGMNVLAAMLSSLLTPTPTHSLSRSQIHQSLSNYRTALDADPAVILIEVDPEADTGVQNPFFWVDFYLLLQEMGARNALMLLPDDYYEPSTMLSKNQREHLQDWFSMEFGLINKNIAILFDAILYGSVRAKDTARFVEDLSSLVDKSKDRLLDDITNAEANGSLLLQKARSVFGEDRLGTAPIDIGYSLPSYGSAFVFSAYPSIPDGTLPFRRLSIKSIGDYVHLEAELNRLLAAMEEEGYFANTPPESHPTILHSQVQSELAELLDAPSDSTENAWLKAKEQYAQSVQLLLDGRAEAVLVQGYKSMLAGESLDETQTQHVQGLRQIVVDSFRKTKAVYDELASSKKLLSEAIGGACCIIGLSPDPKRAKEDVWIAPTAAETAAVQIHGIRTGRNTIIPTGWEQRIFIAIPGLLSALLLCVLGLAWVFAAGILSMLATGAMFSLLFVYTGIFIHPIYAALIPGVAGVTTLLAAWFLRLRYAWAIGPGFGSRLPRPLRWILSTVESPPKGQPISKCSVILAVRCPSEIGGPADESGGRRVAQRTEFHRAVASEVKRHSGLILGAEDFIVLAGFGTPLDRHSVRPGIDLSAHVNDALLAISDLSKADPGFPGAWSFGLDAGECSFYFSSIGGLSAGGRPAVFARILSGLASRHEHRIFATQDVLKAAGDKWETKKLDSLVDKASGQEKAFYALIGRKQA